MVMIVMRALLLLLLLLILLYWGLQEGRRHGLILKTNALFLRRPPLHKLDLSLQFRLLSLYIPKRPPILRIDRGIARLAL